MFVGDAPPSSLDAKGDKSNDDESAERAKPPAELARKPVLKDKDVPSKRKKGGKDMTSTVTVAVRVAGNLLKDVCHASIIDRASASEAPKSRAKGGDKQDKSESAERAKPPAEVTRKPVLKDKDVPSKRKNGGQDMTRTITVAVRVAGNLLKDVCHANIKDRASASEAPKSRAKVGSEGTPNDTTKTDAVHDADVPNLQRFDCPFPGCNKKCLAKKGLAAHYGMMHIGAPKLDWKTITSYEIDPPKPKIPHPSSNLLGTDTCRSAPKRKPPPEDSHLIRYKCPFPGCEKKG